MKIAHNRAKFSLHSRLKGVLAFKIPNGCFSRMIYDNIMLLNLKKYIIYHILA